MADSDSTHFTVWRNLSDDSRFVHEAMVSLGFLCDFAELDIPQMQVTLALAEHLKRAQGQPETWES
jgi:hypothetical protein